MGRESQRPFYTTLQRQAEAARSPRLFVGAVFVVAYDDVVTHQLLLTARGVAVYYANTVFKLICREPGNQSLHIWHAQRHREERNLMPNTKFDAKHEIRCQVRNLMPNT